MRDSKKGQRTAGTADSLKRTLDGPLSVRRRKSDTGLSRETNLNLSGERSVGREEEDDSERMNGNLSRGSSGSTNNDSFFKMNARNRQPKSFSSSSIKEEDEEEEEDEDEEEDDINIFSAMIYRIMVWWKNGTIRFLLCWVALFCVAGWAEKFWIFFRCCVKIFPAIFEETYQLSNNCPATCDLLSEQYTLIATISDIDYVSSSFLSTDSAHWVLAFYFFGKTFALYWIFRLSRMIFNRFIGKRVANVRKSLKNSRKEYLALKKKITSK